ncbi:MAG: hypothetical protein ACRDD1_15955 [Planctomycetia bacterium]
MTGRISGGDRCRPPDWVPGTQVQLHLGEWHMIVVSELSAAVIDAVLRPLYEAGELVSRTLPVE